ncbi:17746_t:CDS:2 [Acaulospora morrowiae]|uniref:17746_t:CDS:1 n=1 Tax=Acaulospora morrowiae TaxID=94023 RepID=A0A9N9G5V9_9GLOM|nr:17746_t:CDS:2 [Acaulospora morrowiae]
MSEHEVTPKDKGPEDIVMTSDGNVEVKKGSDDRYEQHCILFPTYATKYSLDEKAELTDHWNIRIRGWAFSTPKTSRTRSIFLGLASHLAEIQKEDFQSRAALFWASNIDHKEVTVKVVGLTASNKMAIDGDPNDPSVEKLVHEHSAEDAKEDIKKIVDSAQKKLTTSHPEHETPSIKITPNTGNCLGQLSISQSVVKKWMSEESNVPFLSGLINAITRKKNDPNRIRLLKIEVLQETQSFPTYGVVDLVEPEGYSVISDIDDTIKDTEVLSSARTLISNTFLQHPKEVPGMAQLYHEWVNVSFHYVSNSPWQLYPMLRFFFEKNDFPSGSAHLKFYDGIVKSVKEQREHPMASKLMYIGELLKDFPKRKFILVGDTGEHDPEIYVKIARENEGRILRIFVRDVSTEHLKGLPPQPAHHSYAQTFTSTYKRLHSYYSASEAVVEEKDGKKVTETIAEEKDCKKVTETIAEEKDGKKVTETITETVASEGGSAEGHNKATFTSRLMNHLHSEVSHIHDSLGMHSEHSKMIENNTNEEVLKTPLEQFHNRLASLKEGLPEGMFCTFTNPEELRNDPVIRKALNY